jgi:hypothetical protein
MGLGSPEMETMVWSLPDPTVGHGHCFFFRWKSRRILPPLKKKERKEKEEERRELGVREEKKKKPKLGVRA